MNAVTKMRGVMATCFYLTLPLASDAKTPPKQRTAKIRNAVLVLAKKAG